MPGKQSEREKILLALLPVWDPLIPPVGISCLKSFIQKHGYSVRIVDTNVEKGFGSMKNDYFERLKQYIPENKRRHLYNIGHEVLKNHMMAHLDYKNEREYLELIGILVYRTFFRQLTSEQVYSLKEIIEEFYRQLGDYLIQLLDKEKPDVMGLSVYGGTLAASLFAFKLAKERYPRLTTVMGGGVFSGELNINSANFEFFLERVPYIDKIIVGEGERLFLKLLRGQLPGSQRVFGLQDLDGEPLDISSLDAPDFWGLDMAYYLQMASYTSRSCPYRCTFCVETTYWGKFRKKSAGQIADQLLELYKRHHQRLFLMCDSLLNPVIEDLADEFLKRADTSLYWGGYLRVDRLVCDPQHTMKWRQAGFYRARLGIESGSPRVLEMMHKKISIHQVKSALFNLADAGIKTTAMFVIGYPGETEEDFQKTLDLIEECKDDIYEADCNPFWYFYDGQVNSDEWSKMNKNKLLYPEDARDMLLLQTWILDCEPSREETYRRVNRFMEHCNKLRIPNPYTLQETNKADERWKKLHKRAVPSLIEIKSGRVPIDESRKIKNLSFAAFKPRDDGDWRF